MQNMKNAVLVLTAFLFLFPYKLMAENTLVSIEGTWDIEDDPFYFICPSAIHRRTEHLYLFRKGIK